MITHERLKEVLHYNPSTGIFTWLKTLGSRGIAGTRAGNVSQHNGQLYRKIRVDKKLYFEHRLAWFYMTGAWPDPEVDHRDLDGLNNTWRNLREATRAQNMANRNPSKANTSGFKGVRWCHETRRWRAAIQVNKKTITIGSFVDRSAAETAYRDAASRHYGEFARH